MTFVQRTGKHFCFSRCFKFVTILLKFFFNLCFQSRIGKKYLSFFEFFCHFFTTEILFFSKLKIFLFFEFSYFENHSFSTPHFNKIYFFQKNNYLLYVETKQP